MRGGARGGRCYVGRVATRVVSFPPLERADARVLILGTMPGGASLREGRYYAHPRNAFWPILADLLGFDAEAPYGLRASALLDARIALWDVLASCVRRGSLDAAIVRPSMRINEFGAFFASHPRLRRVFFNGATAETLFRRHVRPGLPPLPRVTFLRLPSTSPAHAGMTRARKRRAWRAIRP